jgi:C4-dicarboxylate-specific signal transduction histidine kinase
VADWAGRVASIVRSLKEFAHPDGPGVMAADLNRALESTLIMARGEFKFVADIDARFGDLPPAICHGGI